MRRGHLAWLNAFFAQAIAGHPSNDLKNYDIADDFQKLALIKQLAQVQWAAIEAPEHFDEKLVARKPGQANPALRNFVGRCAQIWRSMTGRKPSANKVATKRVEQVTTKSDDLIPDFVLFVGGLAEAGGLPVPTRKQVLTALNPITVESSSQ
jgi:hypothetical protein